MATSRKKQNDDFLFASDEKASRRKRVAAPTTPVAGPSGPAMSGGPSGPAMSGGPSGPAMSGGPSGPAMSGTPGKVDAPKRRRRAVDENTLKQLYG
ncbi:hypothetical protein [Oligosphaera ethanolica]|uniref:Uncharacterized protein n=1 Tax=Oligosphaera ethanolica TaxID=760260 RepID=A0AAE3VJG7_9BACT|nr:hypothetical protein [Oligosphaera ethanolica]MDQ0291599.1 hypothetical protein [Oligosphaera ethanolica]